MWLSAVFGRDFELARGFLGGPPRRDQAQHFDFTRREPGESLRDRSGGRVDRRRQERPRRLRDRACRRELRYAALRLPLNRSTRGDVVLARMRSGRLRPPPAHGPRPKGRSRGRSDDSRCRRGARDDAAPAQRPPCLRPQVTPARARHDMDEDAPHRFRARSAHRRSSMSRPEPPVRRYRAYRRPSECSECRRREARAASPPRPPASATAREWPKVNGMRMSIMSAIAR